MSVDDFVKTSQFCSYSREALESVAEDVARFAEGECLRGHARSALVRTEGAEKAK